MYAHNSQSKELSFLAAQRSFRYVLKILWNYIKTIFNQKYPRKLRTVNLSNET